jgi:hypothetical protein
MVLVSTWSVHTMLATPCMEAILQDMNADSVSFRHFKTIAPSC